MSEQEWDRKLNIDTMERDASLEDTNYFPYEPTPYCVLERLAKSGYINKDNLLVDYGCGKGRVPIFFNYMIGNRSVGIDFSEKFINRAIRNRERCNLKRVDFYCKKAEEYPIENEADSFYFFNPFSLKILQAVIGKIKDSYYNSPREMRLFFYYPSDEYVSYLMTIDELFFLDEVNCEDLFKGKNKRERVLIFTLSF